jgi:acylphosphatase
MPEPAEKSVRVTITGRVQGVWYRGWTVDQATTRGLRGWVRNRRDGTVEAVFAGPAAAVDAMIDACRHGPSAAVVRDVRIEPAPEPQEPGFQQLPTA